MRQKVFSSLTDSMSDSNLNWCAHEYYYYSSLILPILVDFDKILMTLDLVEMVHKINHEVLVRLFLEDFACQLMFFSLFLTSGFNLILTTKMVTGFNWSPNQKETKL